MSDSPDEDLRDVFRMLYSEDDWDWEDQDLEGDVPSKTSLPDLEIEVIDENLGPGELYKSRHTRKRLFSQLDSLLVPQTSKKPRIYISSNPPLPPQRYLSTDPFPTLPNPNTYSPYTPFALLARLRTFQTSTYPTSLVRQLAPIHLASKGWINIGRDTLICGFCNASWSVEGVDEIRDEVIKKEVERRLGSGVMTRHGKGCAWRIRSSPDGAVTQLRNILHPLMSSSLAPLAASLEARLNAQDVKWSSPQGEKETQILSTRLDDHLKASTPTSGLSSALALFAWYPYPESDFGRTDIIHCRICERRIGLWAFQGDEWRELDLLDEHLGWCPIRHVEGNETWWRDNELVRGSKRGSIQTGEVKGLIRVSESLPKKSWRRSRQV